MILFTALVAPLAALSPTAVGVGECEILDVKAEIVAEQSSPFLPPEQVENPTLTFYIECGVLEFRPTSSGGLLSVATSQTFRLVVEGDDLRAVQVAVDPLSEDAGAISTQGA